MTWIFGMLPPVRGGVQGGCGPVGLALGMDFFWDHLDVHGREVIVTSDGKLGYFTYLRGGVSLT